MLGYFEQLNKRKQLNPELLVAVTGCVLAADKQKLQHMPSVDLVFDIGSLNALAKLLKEQGVKVPGYYFSIAPKYQSKFQAYVPIANGCDNFCAYCAVPYTRGREVSRPEKEILSEVASLVSKGYKEITLLGQNVNSYGQSKDSAAFVQLLEKVNAIPGKFWIRFLSNHPKDMSSQLVSAVARLDKVCKCIHLPVQSGSTRIIARMNRRYTKEHYLALVQEIRAAMPSVTLTTDVIVGFPGETKEDFYDTAEVMEKARFDMAYIAQYSPRPGTAASRLVDDVPKKEKEHRAALLNQILTNSADVNNQKLLNQIVEVLFIKHKQGSLMGLTAGGKHIRAAGPAELVGEFAQVNVTKATPWSLEGELNKEYKYEQLEQDATKRAEERERRRRERMPVSGKNVLTLQNLGIKKAKKK